MFNLNGSAKTLSLVAALALCCQISMAQTRVSGTVVDSQGLPLPGASVVEVGVSPINGTVTDADGNFVLNVKPSATLEVSVIGYSTTTIAAQSGPMLIMLSEDTNFLNESVVVGYGTMSRKDITSSITTVKSEDLNRGVFTDAANMLQGKVAGLVVTTTGDPNGGSSITLRGASSLRSGAMS